MSLWRDTPVYLAVGASVRMTISRVGGFYWRLISGAMQQLALLWMEGHKPLPFPILNRILKFIGVSLGTDFSIIIYNEAVICVWRVMGVLVEADR